MEMEIATIKQCNKKYTLPGTFKLGKRKKKKKSQLQLQTQIRLQTEGL